MFRLCMRLAAMLVLPLVVGSGGEAEPDPLAAAVSGFRQAYDAWDAADMEASALRLAHLSQSFPERPQAHVWFGVARLHTVLHRLGGTDPVPAAVLDAAIADLGEALARRGDEAELHALLATLYGLRTRSGGTLSAMRHGRLFRSHFDRALLLGPDNPRVHYLYGKSLLEGPALLGGEARAREHFRKAAAGFRAERDRADQALSPFWGEAETFTTIGRMHVEDGNLVEAEAAFAEALRRKPRHAPARTGLKGIRQADPVPEG